MGPKFKLIFVSPNLAMQAKGSCTRTRRRNKVIASPQWKRIFPCLESLATLLHSVWVGPFIIYHFSSERPWRIWCLVCVVCICVFICAGVRGLNLLAYMQRVLVNVCVRGRVCVEDQWLCDCVHLFVAIYCLFYFLYYLVEDMAQCKSCEVSQ